MGLGLGLGLGLLGLGFCTELGLHLGVQRGTGLAICGVDATGGYRLAEEEVVAPRELWHGDGRDESLARPAGRSAPCGVVHGARCMVRVIQSMVHGTVRGAWLGSVHGAWCMVRGAWYGAWCMVQCMVHGTVRGAWQRASQACTAHRPTGVLAADLATLGPKNGSASSSSASSSISNPSWSG